MLTITQFELPISAERLGSLLQLWTHGGCEVSAYGARYNLLALHRVESGYVMRVRFHGGDIVRDGGLGIFVIVDERESSVLASFCCLNSLFASYLAYIVSVVRRDYPEMEISE